MVVCCLYYIFIYFLNNNIHLYVFMNFKKFHRSIWCFIYKYESNYESNALNRILGHVYAVCGKVAATVYVVKLFHDHEPIEIKLLNV